MWIKLRTGELAVLNKRRLLFHMVQRVVKRFPSGYNYTLASRHWTMDEEMNMAYFWDHLFSEWEMIGWL